MGTFLARGQDILANPQINSVSGTGTDNAGQVTVSGGTQVFADDTIVEFTTQNETTNGELNGSSGFIGIKIYANQSDYDAGTVQYTYTPQNPGQYANIQNSVDGLGDEYVRFNANVLVSSNAGAPSLTNLFVAPNSDIANTGNTTFQNHADLDINGDGSIDTTSIENGNGLLHLGSGYQVTSAPAVCFSKGMIIDTKTGPVKIEDLEIGDFIRVFGGDYLELKFIYRRRVRSIGHHKPVRFKKHSIGNTQDVVVSQQHRFLASRLPLSVQKSIRGTVFPDCLIQAKHFVNGTTIQIDETLDFVEYFHLMFAKHALIYCFGTISESWQPHRRNLRRDAGLREELLSIFPELADRKSGINSLPIFPELQI